MIDERWLSADSMIPKNHRPKRQYRRGEDQAKLVPLMAESASTDNVGAQKRVYRIALRARQSYPSRRYDENYRQFHCKRDACTERERFNMGTRRPQ